MAGVPPHQMSYLQSLGVVADNSEESVRRAERNAITKLVISWEENARLVGRRMEAKLARLNVAYPPPDGFVQKEDVNVDLKEGNLVGLPDGSIATLI